MREKVQDGSEICAVSVVNTIDTANISPNRNEISEIKSVALPSFMNDLTEDKTVYPIGSLDNSAHDRTAPLVIHVWVRCPVLNAV